MGDTFVTQINLNEGEERKDLTIDQILESLK